MNIARSVTALIGRTTIVDLNRVASGARSEIMAKLESRSPANSVKDHIGLAMIEGAESVGALVPGKNVIIEPNSAHDLPSAVRPRDVDVHLPPRGRRDR